MSHGNARLDVPWSAADRSASQAGWRRPYRRGDGRLAPVRAPLGRPLRRRGRRRPGRTGRRGRTRCRPGPVPRSKRRSWPPGASTAAGRTGSAPSSVCRPARSSRILRRHERAPPVRLRPADRRSDPVLEDDRVALRTRPARRAGPHGRQEDRPDPRRRRLASPRPPDGLDRGQKKARIGYDYVHSIVDDHSRLAYSEILPDEKGPTCAGVPRPRRGLLRRPRHHRDRTSHDRQPLELPHERRRQAAIAALGATHKFIRPHCPWQNGKVERFNRTLPPSGPTGRSSPATTNAAAALAPWLEHYNTQRRHSALGGQPPDQPTVTNLMAEYS